jgi:DNA-binding beta-propeller fold protein YncE
MIRQLFTLLALLIGMHLGAVRSEADTLFVSNRTDITQFDMSGAPTIFTATPILNNPLGLAFDTAGNLYVANELSNAVRRFSPTGVDLGDFASTGLFQPFGLAFDTTGNLYVSNFAFVGGSVRRFSPTGLDLGIFASAGLDRPEHIAFDAAGNLYVSN